MKENTALEEILMLGTRLKQARESANLTIEDVAAKLNLTKSVIIYLESNNYSISNRDVFKRGYLRSYARLLELPAEELVHEYSEIVGSNGTIIANSHLIVTRSGIDGIVENKSNKIINFFNRHIKFITLSFFILLTLIVGVWWHNKFYYEISDNKFLTTEVEFNNEADT
ncbi:MAG: helix-turn-helix domain-containing protein [Legionellales bacterium]|nr:helix-turn-helix domain-containing protein [Legionellales bacterium]